jgi:beta-lactamase class C
MNTRIHSLTVILLSSALVFAPWAVRAEGAADPLRAAVDAAVLPVIAEYDIPGLAMAITVDGQQHFFNYGVASRESQSPVTEDTVFEIGSVSKTFTATLAAYAEASGALSLSDHPAKYLPELAESDINVATLLNLGTYTAGGLPLQFPGDIGGDEDVAGYFQQWQSEVPPGTQRRYSNPSIGLLGRISALALDGEFGDLLEAEIFGQLGLRNSYIRVPEAAMLSYAWGYDKDNRPIRVAPGPLDAEAYGVKSTSADMIAFVESNMAGGVQPPELQQALDATKVGHFRVGEMVQGLGWEQYPFPVSLERLLSGNSATMAMEPNTAVALIPPHVPDGATLFNKTGSTNGFGAYVAFVPKHRIGVVLLANRNFPIPARITAVLSVLDHLTP